MIGEKVRLKKDLTASFLSIMYKTEDQDAELSAIQYIFKYKDIDEAQVVWDWIYTQRIAFQNKYGREADFCDGLDFSEHISSSELLDQNNFWKECWTFPVENSDFKNHSISYCFTIRLQEDAIVVVLDTNESYGTTDCE